MLEERKRNHEEGAQIIEENVGPYLGQMSTVWLLLRSRAREVEVSINQWRQRSNAVDIFFTNFEGIDWYASLRFYLAKTRENSDKR